MLKMKAACESCSAKTGLTDVAYICSYECTFCRNCSERMAFICPNCKGNLVARPTRTKNPVAAAVGLASQKLKRALGRKP